MSTQTVTLSRRVLWFATLILMALPAAEAQTGGQISGYAKDQTGAVIPGVAVTVSSSDIGVSRPATSDASGYYVVTNLPVGTYSVTGEREGFRVFTKHGIVLNSQAAVNVDIDLSVGSISEKVEVTATAQTVATDSAQVGRLIGNDQLSELPVNGRAFLNLVGLQAGVARSGAGFNTFSPSPFGVSDWHFNGSVGYTNLWQIDGVASTRTRTGNMIDGTMPVDSVQEVQIVTSGFRPEFGRNSGAQINFVTKSGTSDFHGSAYWYVRNDKFDARSFFAASKNHLRWNNFGWSLGGPLYVPHKWNQDKQKLFFFFNQEWNRYRLGSYGLSWVPTQELRDGNFNQPYLPSGLTAPRDPLSGLPFPGNLVPKNRINSVGHAVTTVLPLPTSPAVYKGSNLLMGTYTQQDTWQNTVKVDYNLGKTRLTFRGNYTDETLTSPYAFAQEAYETRPMQRPNATLQVVSTLSPTMINELSFGVSSERVQRNPGGAGFDRTTYGIDFPYVFDPKYKLMPDRLPWVDVSGYFSILSPTQCCLPTKSSGPVYQWRDSFTKVLSSHVLKSGLYIERDQENDMDVGGNWQGHFVFGASKANPLTSGNALADLLLGNFDTYEEAETRNYAPLRSTVFEAFAQDSWKVRRDFTLEYGVRWSYMPPFHSKWGNLAGFRPEYYDPSKAVTVGPDGRIVPGSGDSYNGLTLPGSSWPSGAVGRVPFASDSQSQALFHGLNSTLTDTHHNFAPRLGFAWDVGGAHKTAVRGGVGIFYDRIMATDLANLAGVAPLQRTVSVNNGLISNPGGTAALKPIFPLPASMADPVAKTPASYNFSFGIQRQLIPNLLLDVGYVGTRARHLIAPVDINGPALGAAFANPGVALNALRPYKGYDAITMQEWAYNSNYNALQATLTRRLSNGLHFSVAYTWSKAMDESDFIYDVALNSANPHMFRYGRSGFDRRHMLNTSFVYELPLFRGKRGLGNAVLGGWQLSGLLLLQSGEPASISVPGDISGTGKGARPVWVSNPNLPKSQRTLTRYFDTASVARPANGTWGNLGRNVLTLPGINNWDMALSKNFRLAERLRLQFRAEGFNVFNHTQWSSVGTGYGSANFGFVTGTKPARIGQFGLRLDF